MSTTTTLPGLTEALADTLSALDLQASSATVQDLAQDLAGPLITADLGPQWTKDPELVVAVRDDLGDDGERLLDALSGAIAGDFKANAAPPVGTVTDLLDRFGVPTSAIRIEKDGVTVAAVVTGGDRRNEAPPSSGGTGGTRSTDAQPSGAVSAGAITAGIEMLRNVELNVSVELGRTSMPLADVVSLDIGSVIQLDRATGAPVDVRVNGTLLARGEVVVVDDQYAVRVTEIIDPAQEGQ